MKKLFLSLILLALPLLANAYDVEVDGIYYNLNSEEKTAEVTYQKYENDRYSSDYSGSVAIPEKFTYEGVEYSVTSIGYNTFSYCSGLTSVTIPNSVTSIGSEAFSGCIGLTTVTIPNSVKSIGIYAFNDCNGLTSVVIPYSVTSIGQGTFQNCCGLLSVEIPNTVTYIGDYAFFNCSGLTSVTIPNSVTRVAPHAFYSCSNLVSVHITDLEAWCKIIFSDWDSNPLYFAHHLFLNGVEITELIIPNTVNSIGNRAFSGCSGLTFVTIPNSVTNIGYNAFSGCTGLTSVTIPNSVTSIGEYAFSGCSNIKTLTLSEGLTIIKTGTFNSCSSLTEVVIPAKVAYIYAEAFAYCGLQSVTSLAVNPPFAYDNTFSNYNIPLYVPDEAVNSYQATNPWSKFSELKTISGDPIDNKCATPTISYANKKLTFSCETEGVEYVYEITDADIKKGYDAEVDLSATYNISVYATKSGYTNSDVATATLVWTDAIFTETTPETPTSAKEVKESIPVLISANGGVITVKSEQEGQAVAVYTADGKALGSATVKDGKATIATNLQRGEVVIVKVGGRSVKVKMSDF